MNLLITGGAGFIGSHFVSHMVERGHKPVVLDALTYAGNRANLAGVPEDKFEFIQANICDHETVSEIFQKHDIDAVFNFAAETHVDRSINEPAPFLMTNVIGTSVLLVESLKHWTKRGRDSKFRFVQISTDEVYGSLEDGFFSETSPYAPNSPYSASKAGADFLVRAWNRTYGLPTVLTQCSNNYGSHQLPEKLIPATIMRALSGDALDVYGDGLHVRDWIHVSDHVRGIERAFESGRLGEVYCFGGNREIENLTLVNQICGILDEIKPLPSGSYRDQIRFVADRPGHDRRYAIDFSKAKTELKWEPEVDFQLGLLEAVKWYLDNQAWIDSFKRKSQ